jgi:RNA polymerase primary sigma factor
MSYAAIPLSYRRLVELHPPLGEDVERELLARCATDARARERIVLAYIRFAWRMVVRYEAVANRREDAMQVALMGISHAAEKFDVTRHVRFTTYAGWWVRQSIWRQVREMCQPVAVPQYVRWTDVETVWTVTGARAAIS